MSQQPWPMEKRVRVTRKMEKEAERAAARLGASHVRLIAFFADGEYLHMQDVGAVPIKPKDLYLQLAKACEVNEENRKDGREGTWMS